jgi:hypothetical protein
LDAGVLEKTTIAMTEFDPYDRLIESCRNSSQYPYTLLNETTTRSVLEGYHDHLIRNAAALFDDSNPCLAFWEAWPGTQSTSCQGHFPRFMNQTDHESGFKKIKIRDNKGLTEHLVRDGVDPNCRHM